VSFTVVAAGVSHESTLHSFGPTAGTADGASPYAGVIQAIDGNFYGTTTTGGTYSRGTVFKVTPAGVETVLYVFGTNGSGDGTLPYGGLIQASDGNFYGTTYGGGANGQGAVYKITPGGVETVLYSFGTTGSSDGNGPYGGVIQGSDGNFYGTTYYGGTTNWGTVYKISPAGVETMLYSFGTAGSKDGNYPQAGVIQGNDGNFYGTTYSGGANNNGTVYKVTPSGVETLLYSFGSSDGSFPHAGVIQGSDGNFYGTTYRGGANFGYGTVYKVTPSGAETVLYSFGGGYAYGFNPNAGVIQGNDGNFYGTTSDGGANGYYGTIFRLSPAGVLTVLYSFGATGDGTTPNAGVIQGNDGNFYGTTSKGGANSGGTVYKLFP
jgi:uncharacterized repeat protein (TIGR03803 family)